MAELTRSRFTNRLFTGALLACLALPAGITASTKGASSHHTASSKGKSSAPKTPHAAKTKTPKAHTGSSTHRSTSAARDARGRIQRSDAARHAFARQTGYPHGRPGYVIDHIVPLACGKDAPSNMQWQTIAAAKAKDKIERRGC